MRELSIITVLIFFANLLNAQDVGNLLYPHSFAVNSANLHDGKVKYYHTPITVTGTFGMTSTSIYRDFIGEIQTHIVAYQGSINNPEIIWSVGGPTFADSDFVINGHKVLSTAVKQFTITIPLSNGHVFASSARFAVFYKYLFNPRVGLPNWNQPGWAPQVTHNKPWFVSDDKQYSFVKVFPPTTFSGPNNICSEGVYTITDPHHITLENANGIATLTALGNNQWKIARIGNASGKVTLRSMNPSGSNDYIVEVGLVNGRVDGPLRLYTNYHPNNEQIFEIKLNANETFQAMQFRSNRSNIEFQNLGGNKFKVRIPGNWLFVNSPYEDQITITAIGNTSECQKSISVNISILPNPNDLNPGDPGIPVGPGD